MPFNLQSFIADSKPLEEGAKGSYGKGKKLSTKQLWRLHSYGMKITDKEANALYTPEESAKLFDKGLDWEKAFQAKSDGSLKPMPGYERAFLVALGGHAKEDLK